MCYHSKQTKEAQELKKRFNAKFPKENEYIPQEKIQGYAHPFTPVITSENSDEIHLYQWGLIPFWAKDMSIQDSTLNAKVETLKEINSYKNITHQRCLVLANGFYEWKHHDSKGKDTEKFLIGIENEELFAYAGLWSKWKNPSGIEYSTYTIITTQANELMSEIHNTKKRMPIILTERCEMDWLTGKTDFEINHNLIARSLEPRIDLFSSF